MDSFLYCSAKPGIARNRCQNVFFFIVSGFLVDHDLESVIHLHVHIGLMGNLALLDIFLGITLFSLGGGGILAPYKFFLCCIKTVSRTRVKLSDF